MWCNSMMAHAELYMGLVEAGVGLLPGGGGNIEMMARSLNNVIDSPTFPMETFLQRAFETVAMAKVATSAKEAKEMLFLSEQDNYIMNKDCLAYAAKQKALYMTKTNFMPMQPRNFRLPGPSAKATFSMVIKSMLDGQFISKHDALIANKIAHVMTGGDCSPRLPVTEDYLLELEVEAFLSLCAEEKTQERIAYMLQHNKPLRN